MAEQREYFEYLVQERGLVRHAVRRAYLRSYRSLILPPAIDLGCGACELLQSLGSGSLGLDTNPYCVQYGREAGLEVELYSPADDCYRLAMCRPGRFRTLIMCHVLEHIPDARRVLRLLLSSASRLGVERLVVVVPGWQGYRSDPTHVTFVDRRLLTGLPREERCGFRQPRLSYFPGNFEVLGYALIHHELRAVFDRDTDQESAHVDG